MKIMFQCRVGFWCPLFFFLFFWPALDSCYQVREMEEDNDQTHLSASCIRITDALTASSAWKAVTTLLSH